MLKKIAVLIFISFNLCGCLAYNRIGFEEENYSRPGQELNSLMNESYLKRNNINLNLKGFSCPNIRDGNYKKEFRCLFGFFGASYGTPFWGKFHEGYSELYFGKNKIIDNIKCNCKTYKLVSLPLVGGYFWVYLTPGKNKFNNDDAIDVFLREYRYLPLNIRELVYKNQDDFFNMEILPNIVNNEDAVLHYLSANRKYMLIRKLDEKLKYMTEIPQNLLKEELNKLGITFTEETGVKPIRITLKETSLKVKVELIQALYVKNQLIDKNGDPIRDIGFEN